MAAGIEPPVKVNVFPPGVAVAVLPVQVVLAAGVLPITTPVGNVSVSGALRVAIEVLGLPKVMVRVEMLLPTSAETGLKALPSVGTVGVGGGTEHKVTALPSSVTAPVSARALPDRLAAVLRVMLASAIIVPMNAVPVPRVAELPTCQNTSPHPPPASNRTDALEAVVSVLAIWKTQTGLGLPSALR
jgi:hypothetical protein